ncbi:MAG: heparan N-sulfatase, partial [Planctomycetota bacterium]
MSNHRWVLEGFHVAALGVAGCLAWCIAASVAQALDKPNVLIITVDDMSCDSVGAFGARLRDTTPNMDRLAQQAMRFEYAHVQVGNCMPSRNVMWSGRYPHNNRVEGFYQIKDPDYPVLCDLARQAGYFTAIRHKVSHSTPYSPYAWDLNLDAPPDGTRPHVKDAASYGASTRMAIEAARLAGKPFCVLINIADPHKPFYSEVKRGVDPHVPSRIYSAEEVPIPGFLHDDSVIRAELARYYSSVRRADDAVGSVLDALEQSG